MFADLHLHTQFSDGTFSPEELAQRGSDLGLTAMALTDHDTVEGCEPMSRACQARGIEFTNGVELTSELDGMEIHLLGYFVDIKNETLLKQIKKFQDVRRSRIYEMVAAINKLDIPLKADDVFALANCQAPGRPHVARALVKDGFCGSLDEAFERFLKRNRPAWVPKFKISAVDAMELIHQAGGLAVMAHPGLNRTDDCIPVLAEQGLDGIECFHSKHTPSTTAHYLAMAEHFNLLVTGGSDCHGNSKNKPLIGTVKTPVAYWHKLKAAWEARTAPSNTSSAPATHRTQD
jgi:3',5'-nucleoside bisphosphate phosphatase